MFASGYASYAVKQDLERQAQRQFAFACEEIRLKIEARMQAHRQVLLGAAALFDASSEVRREEWRTYARRLEIDQHFNGIQGLGFAPLIPKDRLARHIADIRRQGFPDYTVRPAGERDVYSSVVYLEPFTGRNLRAFGYDMYAEPVRRAAMEQARDGGTVTLSGKVVLVQETGPEVQAGTLMYAPVYRKGMPAETVEQRRSALAGWVYSPFRMKDLLEGVLTVWDYHHEGYLRLRVYDSNAAGAENLLYASEPPQDVAAHAMKLSTLTLHTNFNGHGWALQFEQLGAGLTGVDYRKAWLALAAGSTGSLLLFLLSLSYLGTRHKAHAIADKLAAEMRARALTEELLNARLRLQNAALNAAANAIVITDTQALIEWANPAYAALTGFSLQEAIGKSPKDLVRSGQQEQPFYEHLWQTILADRPWRGELVNRRKDGTLYHEEMTITPVPNGQGKTAHFVAVKQDITARRQTEDKLRESETRFHTMADNAPVLIWTAGLDKLCDYFNKVWLDFTGRPLEQETGNGWAEGVHPDDFQRCLDTYVVAFDARQEFTMEYRLRRHDGEYRWLTDHGVPRYDEQGNFFGYIGSCIDITERHEMEELVRQLAFFDPLTKLPNRRLLGDRLGQAMAANKRKGRHGAVIFLDLDNFKPLNDRHGHAVGDLLLAEVARRISLCVREMDTVARFGGDEFVVLLSELDADEAGSAAQARHVAEKISHALAEPYVLALPPGDGGETTVTHHCTASIGVALFSHESPSSERIIKDADQAMYQAKDAGRNAICFHVNPR